MLRTVEIYAFGGHRACDRCEKVGLQNAFCFDRHSACTLAAAAATRLEARRSLLSVSLAVLPAKRLHFLRVADHRNNRENKAAQRVAEIGVFELEKCCLAVVIENLCRRIFFSVLKLGFFTPIEQTSILSSLIRFF